MMEGEQVFEDAKELLETIRKIFGDPNEEDTHVFQIGTTMDRPRSIQVNIHG